MEQSGYCLIDNDPVRKKDQKPVTFCEITVAVIHYLKDNDSYQPLSRKTWSETKTFLTQH